jgi:hypothetical protein
MVSATVLAGCAVVGRVLRVVTWAQVDCCEIGAVWVLRAGN